MVFPLPGRPTRSILDKNGWLKFRSRQAARGRCWPHQEPVPQIHGSMVKNGEFAVLIAQHDKTMRGQRHFLGEFDNLVCMWNQEQCQQRFPDNVRVTSRLAEDEKPTPSSLVSLLSDELFSFKMEAMCPDQVQMESVCALAHRPCTESETAAATPGTVEFHRTGMVPSCCHFRANPTFLARVLTPEEFCALPTLGSFGRKLFENSCTSNRHETLKRVYTTDKGR